MDKNAILKAIGNPELVRRAATVLKADPGPLGIVHVDTDDTLGYLRCHSRFRHHRYGVCNVADVVDDVQIFGLHRLFGR